MIKHFLIIISFLFIYYHTDGQSIEGIWIGKYSYQKSRKEIKAPYLNRANYIYDFFNDSEFLIVGYKEYLYGTYKMLSHGKYRLNTTHQSELVFIDSNTFELRPRKIKKNYNEEVIIFEKADKRTIQANQDSVIALFTNNTYSISHDYFQYRFEVTDPKEKELILSTPSKAEKIRYAFVCYKQYYFFGFVDPFFWEVFILQLNEFNGNQFISYSNNFNLPDSLAVPSKVILQMDKTDKGEIDQVRERLIGRWKADSTNWKEEQELKINDSTQITLRSDLDSFFGLDNVECNSFEFQFNGDSTYTFINQGRFIVNSEELLLNDTTQGRWILSPTLHYFELIPDEVSRRFDGGNYVNIIELDNRSGRFGLNAFYPTEMIGWRDGCFYFNKDE